MSDHPSIVAVHARGVQAPLRIPPRAATGEIPSASLVLIDVDVGSGIIGHSYVFTFSAPMIAPTVGCVGALAAMIGGDPLVPFEIEKTLRQRLTLIDTPGLVGLALAGIDMACWDALAKVHGVPLVRLLGGRVKPLRAYNSCGLWIGEPSGLGDQALALLAEGDFAAVKLRLGRSDFAADLDAVERVRSTIGADIALMSDFNQSLSVNEALRRCRALDDRGLYWIEEPVRHDDYAGCAQLVEATHTPIQIGENLHSPREMQRAIDAGAGNYYMPDVQRIGGVTGWLRAAALAQVHGLEMSSHLFPEYSRHLLAVTPTAHWLEYVDWADAILETPVRIENGHALIDDVPGVGIAWDHDAIGRYAAR